MTKTLSLLVLGMVVAAGAGGLAWRTLRSPGPREVVVAARDAFVALDVHELRELMGSEANRRIASFMFNEVNDRRSKVHLAKLLGLPESEVLRWNAWQYLEGVTANREKLTVAGFELVPQLRNMAKLYGGAEIGEPSVDGDRAVVTVTLVPGAERRTETVDLVREGGRWKIHYLRWGDEGPLWDPDAESPSVSQRKKEAQTEPKTVLYNLARAQIAFMQRTGHLATSFDDLGFIVEPGNRYTYFLANAGPVQSGGDSAAPTRGAVIVGYDATRHLGQPDLKSFVETKCPLTVSTSGGVLTGLGISKVRGEEVIVVAAAAVLDSGEPLDCWSFASVARVTEDGRPLSAWVPVHEGGTRPFVPVPVENKEVPAAAVAIAPVKERPSPTNRRSETTPEKVVPQRGTVSLSGVEVETAELDRDVVKRQVAGKALDRIATCYSEALGRNDALKGTLAARFTVTASGALTDPEIEENSTGDDGLTTCSRKKLTGLRLQLSPDGDVPVSAKFALTPGP